MYQLRRRASERPEAINVSKGDDALLVASILSKDRKATAEFIARYADAVYSYIRSRLAPQYDQVDDLTQETFLAAWENLRNYEVNGPLQSWLLGIARHKVEDYYRARLRAPEPVDDLGPVLASGPKVHQLLEQGQLRMKTQQVLASLAEPYRLALIWRYWEGASTRDMALKTGKTEKAIERLLSRARAEFRERWGNG